MSSLQPINATSFFTDTINAVDQMIGNFVQTAYEHLIQNNEALITLLFTFYIMWIGYRILTHTLKGDLMSLTRHLGLMLVVYSLLLSWQLYNQFFYNIFTNEPQIIASVMTNSTGQGGSIDTVLNNVFNATLMAGGDLFAHTQWNHILPAILGIIVLLGGSILCLAALALFIYAKVGMAIALALGPIFLCFFLFEPTKGFFNKWLNKLITFALFPIVISCILAFFLSLVNAVLPQIQVPAAVQGFKDISVFTGLCFVSFYFLWQVPSIAASLGGGMSLGGLREGVQSVESVGSAAAAPITATAAASRAVTGKVRTMGAVEHRGR
jgi:type IV secretion system protein VirB6